MRLLLLKNGPLSELFALGHALKELKQRWQHCELTLLSGSAGATFGSALNFIQTTVIQTTVIQTTVIQTTVDPGALNWAGFDALIDLDGNTDLSRLGRQAGIRHCLGPARLQAAKIYHTHFKPPGAEFINQVEYYWTIFRLLDPGLKNTLPSARLAAADFNLVQRPDSGLKTRLILAPFADQGHLSWNMAAWLSLIELLLQRGSDELLLLNYPGTELAAVLQPLSQSHPERLKLVSELDCAQLLLLAQNSRCLVGALGAPAQAAAVLQMPLCLFGPKDPRHCFQAAPFRCEKQVIPASQNPAAAEIIAWIDGGSHPAAIYAARARISAFIVCYNERDSIRRCLESLRWCDEIVVVDSGSTDGTQELCRSYTEYVLQRPWPGYVAQKSFALQQCHCKWVLNLDADEVVSLELRSNILGLLSQPESEQQSIKGYELLRVLFHLGRWWDRGGWYPEWRLRLMQREAASWGGGDPHEKAIVNGPQSRLKGQLYHYSYRDIPHQITVLNRYADQAAAELFASGQSGGLLRAFLHATARFTKFYFLKLGWREGRAGLLAACIEAAYAFLKYARLWELNQLSAKDITAKNTTAKDIRNPE